MRVPPTSLRLPFDALDYFKGGHHDELRYLQYMNSRRGMVVVDGDEVIHGSLFVAASITLGDELITVMTLAEYEARPSIRNPCSEIPLPLSAICNLET